MAACKACSDPKSADVERQIWLGHLTVSDACKTFNMSYEEYWYHLKHHVVEIEKMSVDTNELGAVLRHLVKRLKNRVDLLLLTPVNPTLERGVATQARLLKDIVMDIAKLEHQIEETPQVQIQNFIVQQTELTTFLLSSLCADCKHKVTEYLGAKK